MYQYNISQTPDGILPPDQWIPTNANSKYDCLQQACNALQLHQLPITVHVAATGKLLHPNGTPMITTAYKLERTII